jgi:TolA-binding protein
MKKNKLLTFILSLSTVFILGQTLCFSEEGAAPAEPVAAVSKKTYKKKPPIKKTAPPPTSVERQQPKGNVSVTSEAAAAPAPKLKASTYDWLKKLKERVSRTQAKHNQLIAVGAVRGAEATDSVPFYWKGKKIETPVAPNELAEFDEALNAALKGDNANAKEKLAGFVANHPTSPLVADANEALRTLNE